MTDGPLGRRAAPLIALALLTIGCDVTEPEAAPLRISHQAAPGRAPEPEPADPGKGAFTKSWHTDVRLPEPDRYTRLDIDYSTEIRYAAGHVLALSSQGVAAYGAADGKARWHFYELEHNLSAYALTRDTVVLSGEPDRGGPPYTVALDGATGRKLWDSRTYGPGIGQDRLATGRGVVLLEDPERSSRYIAVDARTGARRWTWERQDDSNCVDLPHDSDGGLLLIEFSCGPYDEDQGPSKSTLYALDPGTGKPVWTRGASWAVSRAGLTLLDGEWGLELVRRDGRVLRRFPEAESGSLVVARGRAVVAYGDPNASTGRQMTSVDPRTGKASEPVPTAVTGEPAVAEGLVYGERTALFRPVASSAGEPDDDPPYGGLLATGIEIVDPRTLRTRQVPLMSADASGFWGRRRVLVGRTMLAGGRLYNAVRIGDGMRITAYVPDDPGSPAELGGVPARDWPDACELLGMPKPPREAPSWNLKAGRHTVVNWSCGRTGENEARVWTAWTAESPRAADRLLDPAGVPGRPLKGVGDEAYRFDPPGSLDDRVLLRVGRHIVVIETPSEPPSKKTAEKVARNLARLR